MIIVRIMGGLGNQMCQFALYEKLKYLNKQVKADINTFYYLDSNRKYELNKFPNLEIQEASKEEIAYYFNYAHKWIHRIEGKLLPDRKKVRAFESLKYNEKVYSITDAYIYGFWQSERYFHDIDEHIRRAFIFPEIQDKINRKYLQMIENENSISIHIRRGDYLSDINQRIYGNICTLEYYRQAIQYFENKYQDAVFFIFSNDTEWARDNLKMRKAVVVEGNKDEKAFYDMMLMSKCQHNIIANSSFSWWGAWLNSHKGKEVVAPSKWVNTERGIDIWCKEWMKIDG